MKTLTYNDPKSAAMKNCISLTFLAIAALLITSCSKENETDSTSQNVTGLDYFPDDSGIVRYYAVDSTYWDEFTSTTGTVSFEIKEVLAGHFIDNQGRNAMRIERYRKDSTGTWVINRVWSSVRTNNTAEVVEENIRYVKIHFPVTDGSTWNGNAYNTLGDQTYEITALDIPGSVTGLNFTNTLHIKEENIQGNLLNDNEQEAKYAKNIGAYYKLKSSLNFEWLSGDTASGYIYKETLTSYILP